MLTQSQRFSNRCSFFIQFNSSFEKFKCLKYRNVRMLKNTHLKSFKTMKCDLPNKEQSVKERDATEAS